MLLKRFIICLSLALTGASCQAKPYTYNYLMEHPKVLKQEVAKCQDKKDQQCEVVMLAAANFMAMLEEEQQDPEAFGQKVLDIQEKVGKSKQLYHEAEDNLAKAKESKAVGKEMELANERYALTKKHYEEVRQEMKYLLAVVSVNSPE